MLRSDQKHAVTTVIRSVPHIASTRSVMMAPSWLRGLRGPPVRDGANRPCARISSNIRRFDVRIPAKRNRAQILRCQ